VRQQARLQVATAATRAAAAAAAAAAGEAPPPLPPPAFEIIHPPALSRGLPPAGAADLYFDLEGYPLAEAGGARTGLEYLWGDVDAVGRFTAAWAHDAGGEEAAFVGFVARVWAARAAAAGRPLGGGGDGGGSGGTSAVPPPSPPAGPAPPPPRVYHYGAYEVSAFRRLGARAGTPGGVEAARRFGILEDEGTFIDIYTLVRSALRVGEESYSIKAVERLMGVSRDGAGLADAASSVALYHDWRRCVFEAAPAPGGGGGGGVTPAASAATPAA